MNRIQQDMANDFYAFQQDVADFAADTEEFMNQISAPKKVNPFQKKPKKDFIN
jgi:hypothetical protein